jgi:hypothetical protein
MSRSPRQSVRAVGLSGGQKNSIEPDYDKQVRAVFVDLFRAMFLFNLEKKFASAFEILKHSMEMIDMYMGIHDVEISGLLGSQASVGTLAA